MRSLLLTLALVSTACDSAPTAPSPPIVVRVPDPDPNPNGVLPRGRNGFTLCPDEFRDQIPYCQLRP